MRQQLSITNWTSDKLSSGFRERNDRFKVRFLVCFENKDLKQVPIPEESGSIVAYENMHFSNGNHETRSLKLADENVKC